MISRIFQIRESSELPFYCSPMKLFLVVWFMMLGAFELHISYTSYPEISTALLLFIVSLCSFLLGYATVRFAYSAIGRLPYGPTAYQIDLTRLRRFQAACFTVAVAILALNWVHDGPPPLFSFFGGEIKDYQDYGSLNQVLFPSFMALLLVAPLDPSRLRRWFFYGFGPLSALAYASRGFLLVMLFQFLAVFSLRTSLSKRKIYLIALFTLSVAITLVDLLGNGRSSYGSAALLGYMQIKRAYYDWPTAYLWIVSYISTPISNLCWIVHAYHYDHPSAGFLYSLVPKSLAPVNVELGDLGSDQIVDGVHTYIAKYFLSLWWLGVFGINYLWGLVSGYISAGNRLARNYLISAVLLGCMAFIFFADFLTFLLVTLELLLLVFAQRYLTIELSRT
jgi:hypothetical protein